MNRLIAKPGLTEFRPFGFELRRVVDGDTVEIDIDIGYGIWLRKELIRLHNPEFYADAFELREDKGQDAKAYVEAWFESHKDSITFVSYKEKRGKYGRALGDFEHTDLFEPTLTEALRQAGFIKPEKS